MDLPEPVGLDEDHTGISAAVPNFPRPRSLSRLLEPVESDEDPTEFSTATTPSPARRLILSRLFQRSPTIRTTTGQQD
jgi:hypothetical protein